MTNQTNFQSQQPKKPRNVGRIKSIIIAVLALTTISLACSQDNNSDSVKQLSDQVAALTTENQNLKSDQSSLEKKMDDLTRQESDVQKENTALQKKVDTLSAKNKKYKKSIENLKTKVNDLKQYETTYPELETKYNDLNAQYNDLNAQYSALQSEHAQLQEQQTVAAAADSGNEDHSATTDNTSYQVYVTNTGSKYHRDGCSYLRQSKIPISKNDAVAQGYTPCSRCNP